MKLRLIRGVALFLAVAAAAAASPLSVDPDFGQAAEFLRKQNLAITCDGTRRDDTAAFIQESLVVVGEKPGNPEHTYRPQRELMAKRGAEIAAQRVLAEYAAGLPVNGEVLLRDAAAKHPAVEGALSAALHEADTLYKEYSPGKDRAIALVRLNLHGPQGLATRLYEKLLRDPKMQKEFAWEKQVYNLRPEQPDTKHDGLIIDASALEFRPALINRIFTVKGEVLYDPAKVNVRVLTEKGSGDYARSVEEARGALARRGVKNPLVVKGSGLRTPPDVQVSGEDAAAIYAAAGASGFLLAAKVAFVMK
ncbi:MAG TPA: hypothetical protein VNX25_08605 [Verrucomicrobiae bacterium]|nr:hypothetical protein [Verrucomicrobiae bacterium]